MGLALIAFGAMSNFRVKFKFVSNFRISERAQFTFFPAMKRLPLESQQVIRASPYINSFATTVQELVNNGIFQLKHSHRC
jgi:hypothetical protein